MANSTSLETLLQEFRSGVLAQPQFEQRVVDYLIKNPHRFSLKIMHPEDRMDFISFYFPRFRRAVQQYRDTGHSFDAYIHRSIQFALRDYKEEEQLHHEEERQLWHQSELAQGMKAEMDMLHENHQRYDQKNQEISIRNPRQVLLLALKSYRYISPDFSRRIARALGIDPLRLDQWIQDIRIKRAKIDEQIDYLQHAVQLCYITKLHYEQQLTKPELEDLAKTKLEWRAARNLQRLEKLSVRLKKIKKSASNQILADVLQIPKGTVDANLFALKQKYLTQQKQNN